MLEFSKYPDKAYQVEWIKHYLGYQAELKGKSKADVTDREIEECYANIKKFALVSPFS